MNFFCEVLGSLGYVEQNKHKGMVSFPELDNSVFLWPCSFDVEPRPPQKDFLKNRSPRTIGGIIYGLYRG